jgi:hypothetical protein
MWSPGWRWLSFGQLDAMSPAFDRLVAQTPEIDGFCSSSDWILPAREAFSPTAAPFLVQGDAGVVALMRRPFAGVGEWACPLEVSWGLASPLIGPDPEPLVDMLLGAVASSRGLRAVALCGLAAGGRAERALRRRATGRFTVHEGPAMARIVASLDGGVDGFYRRRSAKFRETTRRAARRARASGVTVERLAHFADAAAVTRAYERILAIEDACRKSVLGGGLAVPEMRHFYAEMLPRLATRGALRVIFLKRDGEDLAFVFGGLFGLGEDAPGGADRGRGPGGGAVEYRGLQISFDDRYAAESPGVVAHMEMIEWLASEGVASYDLGSDMEYKRRWGEIGLETRTWVLTVGR